MSTFCIREDVGNYPLFAFVHEFQVQVELASYEFNKLMIRNLKKLRGNIMRGYCLMRLKYFYLIVLNKEKL